MVRRKATSNKIALAKRAILRQLKAEGYKVSFFSSKEITAMAKELATKHTFAELAQGLK